MTKEQRLRTEKAIKETRIMLDRAMAYQSRFRDQELIAFCESHLQKLQTMLEPTRPPSDKALGYLDRGGYDE